MRMFLLSLIFLAAPALAQTAADYTPPDMFAEPDSQVSVEDAAIPPLPAPAPPSPAPIIVKAAPPAPASAPAPVTKPLSDALRGVDNKAPPPPLPDLTDNVPSKPTIIPKPDMMPAVVEAKLEPKPEPKPKAEPKPLPKPEPKPTPPPVEKATAVPVTPVEKAPAPVPAPTPPAAAPTAPPQITAPLPAPIVAPDVAPPRIDTSKSPDLATQLIFAPGAADMVPNQITLLAQDIVAPLQENATTRLQIVAYASAVDEGVSSARRISLGRALAIRDHLKGAGIAPERIDVRAMGSETNASPIDRVDLLLIDAR